MTGSIPHLEESLQAAIANLHNVIDEMADLCEGGLRNGLQALLRRDRQLAYTVILRDQCIDMMENELNRLCIEFIVRHQPVAGHLRFVYSTIKIADKLERIGDYAESIAREVLHLVPEKSLPQLDEIMKLGELSIRMLHESVESFINRNTELARKTIASEEITDRLRNSIYSNLYNEKESGKIKIQTVMRLITMTRRFERVADQSKNICEETIYMVTGNNAKQKKPDIFNILFVDSGNRCLSQMAEGIGNAMRIPKFTFFSAGLEPAPDLDPSAVHFMSGKGIDIKNNKPKSMDDIIEKGQINVMVVLGSEIRQKKDIASQVIVFDWPIKNPCIREGDDSRINDEFEKSYLFLKEHIHDLVQAIVGHNRFKNTPEEPVKDKNPADQHL